MQNRLITFFFHDYECKKHNLFGTQEKKRLLGGCKVLVIIVWKLVRDEVLFQMEQLMEVC